MMERTDRHQRVFLRAITQHTLLYTEMLHARAVIHGDRDRLLAYDPVEHPLSLQLGGSDPEILAEAARIAEGYGFDEINLNVGCPSDRVQQGEFGAWLMAHPDRVARCVEAMRGAVAVPITVKHRIGIDEIDRYEDMIHFVDTVAGAGADRFTVHARKAWLQGLSPKENRTVPPLRYPEVWRLKEERPGLEVEINGGIVTMDQAAEHLGHVDAVMIGRAAIDNPWIFAAADQRFFDAGNAIPDREQVVLRLLPYLEAQLAAGERFVHLTRHMAPLFAGQPGAGRWRRLIGENARLGPADSIARLVAGLAGMRA